MAKHQNHEWDEAQNIIISTNLIAAAKKHLQFLEVIDNNGKLYEGPILEKAIFRYKYCWLPLLAKHMELKLPGCQLVIPLDCEWVWHCHRLNPVRYMADCKKLFGRILDPGCVVLSSIEGACKKQTEEIWKKKYPEEPYELDFDDCLNDTRINLATLQSTNYDLVSAVKRQSSFYQQMSKTGIKDGLYLEGAVQRYKGFLHLVRRNIEMKLKNAYVPTYDIDLMWHTHQLHPISYCVDTLTLVGQVLHHDDTDVDQSKDGKSDFSIITTVKQWEDVFGSQYWRVVSMSRGTIKGMEGEKFTASRCLNEANEGEKLNAKCRSLDATMEGQNLIAKCKCLDETMGGQKLIARCKCPDENMEGQKLIAKYRSIDKSMERQELIAKCRSIDKSMEGQEFIAKCRSIDKSMEGQELIAKCRSIYKSMEGQELIAKFRSIDKSMEEQELIAKCRSIDKGMDGQELIAKCRSFDKSMEGQELIAKCRSFDKSMEGQELIAKCKSIDKNIEGQEFMAKCRSLNNSIEGQELALGATKVIKNMLAPRSSDLMFVEILIEIMEVTNIPVSHKGSLVLCISKKQTGIVFGRNRRISIYTETEETQAIVLQCEPKGELLFELSSYSDSDLTTECSSKSFGTTSISLADMLKSVSKLTVLRRLEFGSGTEPVTLSVAISTTPPSSAPYYENTYAAEMDGTAKHRSEMNEKCFNYGLSPVCEEYGDIGMWESSVSAFTTCHGCSGNCSSKCQLDSGSGGINMWESSACSAHCGDGDCSGTDYQGSGGSRIGMWASSVSASSGGCSAKCQNGGGGGGGGGCGAKCHSGGGGTFHG